MARKKRRRLAGKRDKKSKIPRGKRNRRAAKRRPRGVGNKIAGAYRTVIDTVKGTDQLRNKLEPPGTSETE